MLVSLPADDPDRSRAGRAIARELVVLAHNAPEGSRGWLIEEINGAAAAKDPVAAFLLDEGFAVTAMGLQLRVARRLQRPSAVALGAVADETEGDGLDERLDAD